MKTNKQIIILILALIGLPIVLRAQEGRTLPFLEVNSDIRTAGMGDANLGKTDGMYIYNNPAAFLMQSKKLYTSYSFMLYPKVNDFNQRIHAISAGYKFNPNHALLAGYRYHRALETMREDISGERKPLKPFDYSIDMAYAFRLSDNFTGFIGGNFILSYIGKVAVTGGGSLGASYNGAFDFSGNPSNYTLTLALENLGGKVQYGKNGVKSSLPTSIGLGGDMSLQLQENHALNVALLTRYFFLPKDAAEFTAGLGLEYELYKKFGIRAGYHYGKNNGYFTCGLGYKLENFSVNAAYQLAKESNYNLLRLGLNVYF